MKQREPKRRRRSEEGTASESKEVGCQVSHEFVNTPNNFEGGKISYLTSAWKEISTYKWILSAVNGTVIDEEDLEPLGEKKEISFPKDNMNKMDIEVEKLLNKKVIQKVTGCEKQVISNIFCREKKNGSLRIILNLKEFKGIDMF